MASCKDCIHDKVCDMWAVEVGLPFVNADTCDHFKNKADYEKEKHGEWIPCGDGDNTPCVCSACCKTSTFYKQMTSKYCPNCGVKME